MNLGVANFMSSHATDAQWRYTSMLPCSVALQVQSMTSLIASCSTCNKALLRLFVLGQRHDDCHQQKHAQQHQMDGLATAEAQRADV